MSVDKIYTNKKLVRKKIRELKQKQTPEQNHLDSNIIFDQVEGLAEFKTAKTVFAYWSLPDEVHTHNFIIKWSSKKKIALPIIVGDSLEFRLFDDIAAMNNSSSFGILEPHTGALIYPEDVDFAIIPGVAFDHKGNRLGRGKGYYDKILGKIKGIKIGVGFAFQIVDEVPVTSYDIPVDMIISTKNQMLC